jgi:hypothetical protein
MYGSEVWTLSQGAANKIDSFERKILRKIFGANHSKGVWRIRYSDELYKMYKDVPLSVYISLKKLMWAGHVVRMEQHRIPKKVLRSCFGGGRPVRRPRNRWEDAIQRDAASLLRIWNWRAAARDREEWRKKVGEAMAENGPKRHRRRRRSVSVGIPPSDLGLLGFLVGAPSGFGIATCPICCIPLVPPWLS